MQTEAGRNSCFPNIENSFGKFVQKEAINASASTDILIITAKQKNICMQEGIKTTLQLMKRKIKSNVLMRNGRKKESFFS